MKRWQARTLLFLTSQAITLFGSTLVQMAIVWFVTLRTGEGAWIAAFTVASYLPQFLISIPGGAWADRYSRKALIIGADAAIALVTLGMWFLLPRLTDEPLMLPLLLAMSALRSLGAGIQTPAVNAVLPQLVPEEQLMRCNGMNAAMQSIVQFAAPAAAGAVLSVSTLDWALLIDVATAAVGVSLFSPLALPRQPAQEAAPMLADMKAGIAYVLSQHLLRTLMLVYGLFIFLSVPAGFLAQLFVSRTFGDTYLHLTAVEVTGFLGMMAGGILMSAWGGFRNRMMTLTAGLAVFGLLAAGLSVAGVFPVYLTLMFLYGVPMTMIQTAVTTLLQENAVGDMQGRVFGLLGTMYAGFLPVGMVVFGPMADVIPLTWLMAASGAALVGIAIALRCNRRLWPK